jgi:hypothetical protein
MTLTAESSLVDVAFAVCTALDRIGTVAVLTGGSAATYYCPQRYQSLDADFVLRIAPARRVIDEAMAGIGFLAGPSGMYAHGESRYTVEFPRGPLSIGRDVITNWLTKRRDDELLYITSVTDCVRDRFMHFWAWNDRSALDVALAVATAHREAFETDVFLGWAQSERQADRSYQQEKVDEFVRRLANGYIS